MSTPGVYALDHLPLPTADSESATAVLVVTEDGDIFTVSKHYVEEGQDGESFTITRAHISGDEEGNIVTSVIPVRDHSDYWHAERTADAMFDAHVLLGKLGRVPS